VLVAGAAEVCDTLAAEEREVTLHPGGHRSAGEFAPVLAFGLAVEDRGAKRGHIELSGDGRQVFAGNRGDDAAAHAVVELFAESNVVDVIVFNASVDELLHDFRKGQTAGKRSVGGLGDGAGIHAVKRDRPYWQRQAMLYAAIHKVFAW
jgi:hypothetical protein